MLKVLNLIRYHGYYCSFCKNFEGPALEFSRKKWTFSRIPFIFCDSENWLDTISNNHLFIKSYHQKLVPYLLECYDVDPTSIECVMFDHSFYLGRDYSTNERLLVMLKEHIAYKIFKRIQQRKKSRSGFYGTN